MVAVTRNSEYRIETNEDGVTSMWRVKNLMDTDHPNVAVGETRQGILMRPVEVGLAIMLEKAPGKFFITSPVVEVRK